MSEEKPLKRDLFPYVVGGSILIILIIVNLALLDYYKSSDKLCVFSYPSSCKYFCPSLDKNVTDLYATPTRIIQYIDIYNCTLISCYKNDLTYEINNCSYYQNEKKFVTEKYEIKVNPSS